ncbi:MAG: 1,4-alpha-glucan branching protein, partial [Anaerolineae bacterium]
MTSSRKMGAFTFVLHSHIPYCRRAGRWPHGEEWLHEAIAETYIPLLNALYDLQEEGVPFHLTIGITPILCEQLADPLVLEHLRAYLQEKQEAAEADIRRFDPAGERQLHFLAGYYAQWYAHIRSSLDERFGGDIIGAFRHLQDAGRIEILTSAATHGYLPLLARDSSISAQLTTGVRSYMRHFGRRPRAIWLPECAYRPAYYVDASGGHWRKPGIEEFLAEQRLGLFFCETHAIEGGTPIGKARESVIGPYGEVPKRYLVPIAGYAEPTKRTTYRPYYVAGTEVAVMGRNNRTSMQVWSADWGYPGDGDYREFHKKDGISGMQYWRVTGPRLDLSQKDLYHPDWAEYKAHQHARHFAGLVEELLAQYARENAGDFGIIAAMYDTELFGHWWFEGILWMREVLRNLAGSETVELTTASDYLAKHPPEDVLALPESSWGAGGTHFTWDNPDTHWMWEPIHQAELRM